MAKKHKMVNFPHFQINDDQIDDILFHLHWTGKIRNLGNAEVTPWAYLDCS